MDIPNREVLLLALGLWNLLVCGLYGFDKSRARRGGKRVSERNLLLAALSLGTVGAWIGMLLFRHKTRKGKFLVPLVGITALQVCAVAWYLQSCR